MLNLLETITLSENNAAMQPIKINSKIHKLLNSMSQWLFEQKLLDDFSSKHEVIFSEVTDKKYYYFDKIINSKLVEFIKESPYLKKLIISKFQTISIEKNSLVFVFSNDLATWSSFYASTDTSITNNAECLIIAYHIDNLETIKPALESEPLEPKKRKIIEIKAV